MHCRDSLSRCWFFGILKPLKNKINYIICLAWIDGTAILIAVVVVSGIGSIVDWQKEIEFVNRANDDQKGNVVSIYYFELYRFERYTRNFIC